jgi:hypothetical protein
MPKALLSDQTVEFALRDPVLLGREPLRAQARLYPSCGGNRAESRDGEQRYSPAEVVVAVPREIMGRPVRNRICTSRIERQNLSIRMGMRRAARLTNAFSKRRENLQQPILYGLCTTTFCRRHAALPATPVVESGF